MIIPIEHWEDFDISVKSARSRDTDPIKKLFEEDSPERVALNLHVGSVYTADFATWTDIDDGFTLQPGQCVRIEVDEKIKTPDSVFGQVCSKTSQSADGLFVANLKVDPNFEGQITPTVFNAGDEPVRLTQGLVFSCVWFGTLDPVPKDPPHRNAEQKRTVQIARRSAGDIFDAARPHLLTGTVTMLATLVAALLLKL
jgi:deoxycytidine triphosphate deaminase